MFMRTDRVCKYCKAGFPDDQSILKHYALVNNHGFAIICHLCGKGFKTVIGQQQHQRMEHESGKDCPRCEICNKVFSAKSVLMVHRKVHSDYRPWKCSLCGSEFKHKHVMLRHERTCKSKLRKWFHLIIRCSFKHSLSDGVLNIVYLMVFWSVMYIWSTFGLFPIQFLFCLDTWIK